MKYFVLISSLLVSFHVFSQGINFFDGNVEALKAEAAKKNKIIFVDCYTSWCGPCKWLAKNVFTNTNVGKYYNRNFVCYSLDMEKGEGKEFQTKYGINAYPTLLFINASGEIQHRYVGACDTTTFIGVGKQALDTTNNFGSLLKKYNHGNRNPDFLAKYALTCASVYYSYDVNEYFLTQADSQLTSAINFEMMERYRPNVLSREYKYLMTHVSEYISKYSFYRVYQLATSTMTRTLYTMSEQKDFDLKKQIDVYIQPLQLSDYDYWKNAFVMDYYSFYKTRDDAAYINESSTLLTLTKEHFPVYLGSTITIIMEYAGGYIKDTDLLKKFSTMIEPYSVLFSSVAQLKMANIYIKLENKTQAEVMLNKAKEHVKDATLLKEYHELVEQCNALK
jgi:thiol-disulfide isomerase/thioredoxin